MKTFRRLCLKDLPISEDFKLLRGKEYLTSDVDANTQCVTVFSTYWVGGVPVSAFGGEIESR